MTTPPRPLPAQSSGTASSLALNQYIKAAQAAGIEVAPLLAAHGIDPARLEDVRYRTALWRLEALIGDLLAQSGDPLFGLHTAQQVDLGTYNVLGYMSNHVSNLREMCGLILRYEGLFGDLGTTRLIEDGPQACLRWSCQLWAPEVARHVTETTLGSWYGFVRRILQLEVPAARVSFTHPAPADPSCRAGLEAHFGAPVEFAADHNSLWFDLAHLDAPWPGADPTLLATLLGFADDLLAQVSAGLSLSDQVRRALAAATPGPGQTRDAIARSLGLSGRSLHRRLEAEGTGFQALLDEVRFEAARRELSRSARPVAQIAADLGYREVRSFYRSFKSWSGLTVGEFRAGQIGAQPRSE